ncbi:MAG: BACON domain-containing protein [Prevotella sp.]|nr:BACON domain-containing protein [Prevotella sp.]
MKKLFTLLTLLLTVVGGVRAADFVDTYGTFGTVTGSYIGSGISKIALGDNASANSGIQASSEGATLKFTVSTPTGFTIKSVVFKGSNTGTISCNDDGGALSTTSGTTTLTASADKASVEFTVESSADNKKAKLTNFIVTVSSSTTDDYELITPTSISEGNITYSSSLGDDKLVTAMAGIGEPNVGASDINFGNGKGFSITTSRAIKSIYCVWCQRAPQNNGGWTGYSETECTNSIGTYTTTTNAWVALNENTKFVAFKSSEGSTHKLSSIHIFYYNSPDPSVSASTVLITEDATDAGEISYTVDAKGTSGTVTASTEADWITLGAVDEVNKKVPFTATANSTSVSRSATVTLTYTYNTSETVTKDVTVTQGANVKGESLIKVTLEGNKAATVTGAIGGMADVSVQSDKKFGSGHYAGFTLAGGNTFYTGDIINVRIDTEASGSGTIAIYDTDKSTILYDTETRGSVGNNKFVLPAACNGKTSLYICRTSANGWNAVVDYIEVIRPIILNETATSYTPEAATDVTVSLNRTLSNSYYNTICLPFDVDLTDSESPLYGADVQKFDEVDGTTLKFVAETTTMTAGTPYLVKPTSDLVNPVFEGVDVKAVAAGTVTKSNASSQEFSFKGTYTTVVLNTNKTHQFLNTNSPQGFSYPSSAGTATMKGLRAYFVIPSEVISASRMLDLSIGGGGATGIEKVKVGTEDNVYYDLQGHRVLYPTKGLYIVNGKKVIIK